jgi:hypothetical protein
MVGFTFGCNQREKSREAGKGWRGREELVL